MDNQVFQARKIDSATRKRRRARKKLNQNNPITSISGGDGNTVGRDENNRPIGSTATGGNGGGGGSGGSQGAPPLDDTGPKFHPNSPEFQDQSELWGQQALDDPTIAATRWMQQNGFDTMNASGITRLINDLSDYAPQLFYLTQGGGGNSQLSTSGYLDFVSQFLDQYTKPYNQGGGGFSPNLAGNILFGNGGFEDGSMLDNYLNDPGMTPGQQINALLGMAGGAMGVSMPAAAANAMLSALDQEARNWMANLKMDPSNPDGTLRDYLASTSTGRQMRR